MAVLDPKQMLLRHVEKVVLVLAVLVLFGTIWLYPPWGATIEEANEINKHLNEIGKRQEVPYTADLRAVDQNPRLKVPPGIEEVPDYVDMITKLIQKPWSEGQGINEYPRSWVVFQDEVDVIWTPEAPAPPKVEPPTEVLVKAEKGRVIVIFKIDHAAQRRILEETRVPKYIEGGLPFHKVTIKRKDVTSQEPPRDLHEGQNWLPEGLSGGYGAPAKATATGTGGGALLDRPLPWQITDGVVVLTQRGDDRGGAGGEDPRRRIEEEMRRQEEERRRGLEEAEKARQKPPSKVSKPSPQRRAQDQKSAPTAVVGEDEGYYWFVDNDVDTEGKYSYSVTLTVENPVYKSKEYDDSDKVPPLLTSGETISKVAEITSFKEWYFTGGSTNPEQGWCVVRVLTSMERQLDRAAVRELARQIKAGGDVGPSEPVGEWVRERFEVRPGQEIGGKKQVRLAGGQAVDVDFATGVHVIAISEGFQVVEVPQSKLVQNPAGGFERVEVLQRSVVPKLKITVVDRKEKTYSRWQAVARDETALRN